MEIFHQIDEALGFILNHAIFAVSIVLVYEGTCGLVSGGNRRNNFAALISGVLIMSLMAAQMLWVSHTMVGLNKMLTTPDIGELSTNWAAHRTPEEREKHSRYFASSAFTGSGKTVKYFDRTAGWQRYCPTDVDLADREKGILLKQQSQQLAEEAYSVVFHWLAYGIVAAGLGVYCGRRRTIYTK